MTRDDGPAYGCGLFLGGLLVLALNALIVLVIIHFVLKFW